MEAGWLWKILGMLPLALHVLIREYGYKHFVVYYDYAFKQPEIGAFSANPKYALTLLIAVVLTALILILPFRLCRGRDRSWLILLLLLLGGGSRLMMGLSPTIYASGYRTYTLLLFAVGICCVLLLKEIWERGIKPLRIAGLAAFAVVFLV